MAQSKATKNERIFKAVQGVAGLTLSWFLFIRAVDTGSLQQYGLLILILIISVNRLFRAAVPKKK
ncbi:hypothetical protein EKI60_04200 [Candidatus Saccharibacteria bacterium]|nr:MAG: hypothetical protein EKI60_04200 [Candidatus Saccharibacteria bacterium]